ncbi:MAG: hypothetical protein RI894_2663 [Bacteroidota bacterium]
MYIYFKKLYIVFFTKKAIMQKIISTTILVLTTILTLSAQTWVNVGVPVSGSINSLASFAGNLYVGGNFNRLNGTESDFTAIYDGTAVTAHVQAGITGTSGINSLYVASVLGSPLLFALGDLKTGTSATSPAYCTTWATGTGWGNAAFRTPSKATCMAAGTILVGANTADVQFVGLGANTGGLAYVARYNGAAWAAAGSGFNAKVNCLEIYGGTVYAGGDFTASGTTVMNHLAKWDATTSKWVAVAGGCNGNVRTLKSYNGALYIGGDFALANGVANTRLIAKYDGTSFSPVGGGVTAGASVRVIQAMNGSVYVGGDFTKVGTVSAKNIAAIATNAPYWTSYGSGVTSPVNTLIYHAGNRYLGQGVTGTAANYLKMWSTTVATQNEEPHTEPLTVFPNPASNEITVKTSESMKTIHIYSLSGSLLSTETNIDSNMHTLSIENLPQGAYLVYIVTKNGKTGVQKVVKW